MARGHAGTWARGQGGQTNLTQRETGDRMIGGGEQVSGLGSRQSGARFRCSGTGYQVQVQVRGPNPKRLCLGKGRASLLDRGRPRMVSPT